MARGQGGTLSGFTPLSTPNAPTDLSVSTSIGSAEVSFTAPTDTGDGAVTSFIVTAIDESTGASAGATGSASPITVSPPAGGTFKIRAQAVNGFGPGRLTEFDTGHLIYVGAELYAWGSNGQGQVGDNTSVSKSSPVQIGALTTWDTVSTAEQSSFAVKTDGTFWSWGLNSSGELGDNSTTNKSSPIQVGALTNWSFLGSNSKGAFCSAIKTDGTLWTWGSNTRGQLGDSTSISRSSPVQIGSLTNWAFVGVGRFHALAVTTSGILYAWGRNEEGQVGDGTGGNNNPGSDRSSPVQIGALTNWAKTAGGYKHSLATKTDGTLWGFGFNRFDGQLGLNNVSAAFYRISSPVQVGALTNWNIPTGCSDSSACTKTDGTLWVWGNNGQGQLGDGTSTDRISPVQLGALTNWGRANGGENHFVAIKTDGTLWTWGQAAGGKLGDGTILNRSSPVQIGLSTNWIVADAGDSATIAIEGVI